MPIVLWNCCTIRPWFATSFIATSVTSSVYVLSSESFFCYVSALSGNPVTSKGIDFIRETTIRVFFQGRWTNDQLAWKREKKEDQDLGHARSQSNEWTTPWKRVCSSGSRSWSLVLLLEKTPNAGFCRQLYILEYDKHWRALFISWQYIDYLFKGKRSR